MIRVPVIIHRRHLLCCLLITHTHHWRGLWESEHCKWKLALEKFGCIVAINSVKNSCGPLSYSTDLWRHQYMLWLLRLSVFSLCLFKKLLTKSPFLAYVFIQNNSNCKNISTEHLVFYRILTTALSSSVGFLARCIWIVYRLFLLCPK